MPTDIPDPAYPVSTIAELEEHVIVAIAVKSIMSVRFLGNDCSIKGISCLC